jgi:hypothetical protein
MKLELKGVPHGKKKILILNLFSLVWGNNFGWTNFDRGGQTLTKLFTNRGRQASAEGDKF